MYLQSRQVVRRSNCTLVKMSSVAYKTGSIKLHVNGRAAASVYVTAGFCNNQESRTPEIGMQVECVS